MALYSCGRSKGPIHRYVEELQRGDCADEVVERAHARDRPHVRHERRRAELVDVRHVEAFFFLPTSRRAEG